jgi:MinD-like ATPase involved in chromosome partitioning or flagellar assembly
MIDIFHKCSLIETELHKLKNKGEVVDFKIFLRTNENLYVYILSENLENNILVESTIIEIFSHADVEFLTKEDLEEEFYEEIFNSPTIINIEKGRRRFDSLLSHNNDSTQATNETQCPVITFYSYKGGMGRSTTLAAFATHLALVESKNVIIIDCDFEAPGFTNFFLKNAEEENQRQGFVEYFLDKESGISSEKHLESYTWEVESKFSGSGSIRIMPAGNLDSQIPTNDFLKTNLSHYVEGLARIDFTNQEYIIEQFTGIINDLRKSFSPDVILIDARTGFSEVMGVAAFQLSKFVVGFFRNDAQSLPGLTFFLRNMVEREYIEPYLINSILPSSIKTRNSIFNSFKEDVKNIIETIQEDYEATPLCFPISRNENLELLGTKDDDSDIFVELIRNGEIKEFKDLFEKLCSNIISNDNFLLSENYNQNDINDEHLTEEYDTAPNTLSKAPDFDMVNSATEKKKELWKKEIKERILNSTREKIQKTSLYAENLSIEDGFDNNQFFFRTCMNDLFNIDKFMILGSKGTGKSYIYNALKSVKIVESLKAKANKIDNFHFIYTIDRKDRFFKVDNFQKGSNKQFQYRFWLIYTWQIISKDINSTFSDFPKNEAIEIIDIREDVGTQTALERLINDDNSIIAIEKEFARLDSFLVEKGNGKKEYLTILYDQLDEIIDPNLWNDWMPSLIEFWRYKRHNRIFGKLFVRKDLFRKLVGINNVNDIENQAIDIEWSQEEMFSYFFKIVLSDNMEDWMWALMYLYKDYDKMVVKQNRIYYNKIKQTSLQEPLLRPLATTFFGKNVNINKITFMGESYDWFYNNLKNADDTISLRPFIDLINFALESNKDKKYVDEDTEKPILLQKYYTDRAVRLKAVERHFDDLVRHEKGNQPIRYIFEYFNNASDKYKKITLPKSTFEELLQNVITDFENEPEMKNQDKKTLEALLITNGIVKKNNHGRGDEFKFAFLYKYKLGLKGA